MSDNLRRYRCRALNFALTKGLLTLCAALLLSAMSPLATAYNADLKINKLAIDDTTPNEDQIVSIEIQAKNNGSQAPVPLVYVDAPLPPGLSFVDTIPAGATYAPTLLPGNHALTISWLTFSGVTLILSNPAFSNIFSVSVTELPPAGYRDGHSVQYGYCYTCLYPAHEP